MTTGVRVATIAVLDVTTGVLAVTIAVLDVTTGVLAVTIAVLDEMTEVLVEMIVVLDVTTGVRVVTIDEVTHVGVLTARDAAVAMNLAGTTEVRESTAASSGLVCAECSLA